MKNKILIVRVSEYISFMESWKEDDPDGFFEIDFDDYVNDFVIQGNDYTLIDAKLYDEKDLLLIVSYNTMGSKNKFCKSER